MRKTVFFFMFLAIFITFTNASATTKGLVQIADRNEPFDNTNQVFQLPKSLQIIEESAFEGTALTTVNLSENVEIIEDNAFANIPTLKQINIPNSTTFIGKDAFKGSNQFAITAAPKSYARGYAQENKIPFNPVTSFYAFVPSPQTIVLSNSKAKLQELVLEGETTNNHKTNPTGRMAGELNADRYEGFSAFHIQGRSPPMA